jgi:single-strand DNA-binding protein
MFSNRNGLSGGCKFVMNLFINLLILKVMSSLANRVTLIGNLGQDPETKTLESGKKVVHFTMATNDGYKNSDGQRVNETTWHNIVAWNGLAERAQKYLKKGNEVALEGRIVYRTYEDKKGVTKYITEIVLNDLELLRNGKKSTGKDEEGQG